MTLGNDLVRLQTIVPRVTAHLQELVTHQFQQDLVDCLGGALILMK